MLIDANVFNGFFQTEMGLAHILQGCPKALMAGITTENPIIHDSTGFIEHEWRNVVDREWFDVWLASQLQNDLIQFCEGIKDNSIESKLRAAGFPNSRDIIYIRVALAVANQVGTCFFFTEDLDFFDPSKKGCNAKSRVKILQSTSSPVCKILAKKSVSIRCVP